MYTFKYFLKVLAKILTFTLFIASLVLIGISLFKKEWIEIGIEYIGKLIHTIGDWNYLVAFSSACIESLPFIGTAVPGMNIMILVGGFWAKEHFLFTILCAIIGAMLGNYCGYWIGKYYGKELIHKYGEWFGIGTTEEAILKKQIEKNGFWYIVLGKFHNFTRSFVPFIAGSAKMLERNFWLYNMIGSIIWALSINLL
jgi:membrane-associated protein